MIRSNRYLVVWVSSVAGKHHESYETAERAEARLDAVGERAFFDRGVVIDRFAAGAQRTPEEFRQIHESHSGRVGQTSGEARS